MGNKAPSSSHSASASASSSNNALSTPSHNNNNNRRKHHINNNVFGSYSESELGDLEDVDSHTLLAPTTESMENGDDDNNNNAMERGFSPIHSNPAAAAAAPPLSAPLLTPLLHHQKLMLLDDPPSASTNNSSSSTVIHSHLHHGALKRKTQPLQVRELSSESEYGGTIEAWEPSKEDTHTFWSILYHISIICLHPCNLLQGHVLRGYSETNLKVLGPELFKIDNALRPISDTESLLEILYGRVRSRYSIVKYLERAGLVPKRTIDMKTQEHRYRYKRVYLAYVSLFFCFLNIVLSILALLCQCIHVFPYTKGRAEFIHLFIAGGVQFIALIISTRISLNRLQRKGECCELDIFMMYRAVRPSLIMFTISVIAVVLGLVLDIIFLNLFYSLSVLHQTELVVYTGWLIGMQYYISAYLAVALFFVLVDAKVCSALIDSLGFHIDKNTISWEVYLKVRQSISERIEAAQFQNLMMIAVAYTNVADIIISFAQDPRAIGIETMCYFSRELFFLLFVFFEISKINEKADGLVDKVLVSSLTGDRYHKILNHLEKAPISYTLFGWRPKKFNVLYQLVSIVALPILLRIVLIYYPQLAVLLTR